jgi:hypothetical protein
MRNRMAFWSEYFFRINAFTIIPQRRSGMKVKIPQRMKKGTTGIHQKFYLY